jgi:asparagine synthase (glutamine-hydrolysing)
MSGIVAIYKDDRASPSQTVFQEMSDKMAYRAVDGQGVLCRETVRLGHQQFYTTPEEVGEHQPLFRDDIAITFDGRIDNHAELRPLLSQQRSGMTDAEILVALYQEYGVACFSKIIGPFALCLWDERANRVVLARDKTGIRHLFYAHTNHGAVVCSDMHPLTVHPDVRATINTDVALSYLYRRQRPGETFYTDIQAVVPGEYVIISGDDSRTHRYWQLEQREHDLCATEPLAEMLDELLTDAIECRLRGVHTPGIMLSGGVDSTAVASIASKHYDGTLCGYSVVFDDYPDGIGFDTPTVAADERQRIDEAVTTFGIDSETITGNGIAPFTNETLHDFTFADNPCHTTTQTVNDRLFKQAARDECRILLTGHDAEYLRGTYLRIADFIKHGQVRKLVTEVVADDAAVTTNLLNRGVYPLVAAWMDHTNTLVYPEQTITPLSIVEADAAVPPDVLHPTETRFDFTTLKNIRLAEVFRTDINRYAKYAARRIALTNGVELRYPFADARLFEFIVALPPGELLQAGTPYQLYKQVLTTILPPSIVSQLPTKSTVSFGPMRQEGLLQNEGTIRDLMTDLQTREYLPIDQQTVTTMVDEIYSQLRDEDREGYDADDTAIWPLLQIEYWLRRNECHPADS